VIDLHSHVLPGLDDGPPDMAGSLALAHAAARAGTRVMAATPHVGHRYPVVPGELAERVAVLNEALAAARIPLDVVVGGERLVEDALGGSSCLLVECPFVASGGVLPALATHFRDLGFRVLLAHPERSPECHQDPELLPELVEDGCFVQLTASSFAGDFGRTVRRYAHALLAAGLVHVVASDAHDAADRGPEMLDTVARAVRRAGLPPEATEFLTEDAPRALLEDTALPRFPVRGRARRVWARRR